MLHVLDFVNVNDEVVATMHQAGDDSLVERVSQALRVAVCVPLDAPHQRRGVGDVGVVKELRLGAMLDDDKGCVQHVLPVDVHQERVAPDHHDEQGPDQQVHTDEEESDERPEVVNPSRYQTDLHRDDTEDEQSRSH